MSADVLPAYVGLMRMMTARLLHAQVGYMRMMTSEGASSVCVPPRAVTREELRQHRAAGDAWIALSGKVYDISAYLGYHPGVGERYTHMAMECTWQGV